MDELEKHIQQRLDELNADTPNLKGWDRLERRLFPPRRFKIVIPMGWAVAACMVLLAGIGLFLFNQKSTPSVAIAPAKKESKGVNNELIKPIPTPKAEATKDVALLTKKEKITPIASAVKRKIPRNNRINEESLDDMKSLENIENSFTQVINMEKERVNTMPLTAEDPGYFKDFGRQINEMEVDEAAIKKEIKRHGITDGLLDRLINIYQQKLNVLKQLQKEIQKTNNRYKQGRTREETPKLYFLNI